jgi:bifunctional aspartokinase / homoserine dehydrogenase 1
MKVLKFGGTSVGSAENIRKVREIVKSQQDDVVIVVSALGGITDKILNAAKMAVLGTEYFNTEITEIRTRHEDVVDHLFEGEQKLEVWEEVSLLLDELARIIRGVSMIGELTPKTMDKIGGFGERLSSYIIAQFIEGAKWIDASQMIKTDSAFGRALVDFKLTNQLIKDAFGGFSGICVAPGFVFIQHCRRVHHFRSWGVRLYCLDLCCGTRCSCFGNLDRC